MDPIPAGNRDLPGQARPRNRASVIGIYVIGI
jgi:hypothetical protein